MTQFDDDGWEEIAVPRGAYIGWGEKGGQVVLGEVLAYGDDDGTDFDGKTCPQVSVILMREAHTHSKKDGWSTIDAGELAVINGGQSSLKRALVGARMQPGDLMRLEMKGMEDTKGGKTVKVFSIKVKRGNGELSPNARQAMAKADDSSQAGSNGGRPAQEDPWGSPTAYSGAGDEPPF